MPGIAGFVDFSHSFGHDTLLTMLDQIKYSDRFVVDSYRDDSFAIGRADVPTFNPDPQPLTKDDLVVFFQGNIMNKDEVLEGQESNLSNASIIARQYLLTGTNFVNQVKGQFATAIWDSKKQRLFLVNDRFGKHQMYLWSPRAESLFFACETKSIIPIAKDTLRPNLQAMVDFLQLGFLPGNETYFENISLLPYASILQFDKQGLQLSRYWTPRRSTVFQHASDRREYCKKLHDLVSTAVLRAVSVPHRGLGLLLSGGLDSRNIAAHTPSLAEDVHSFSYGESDSQDSELALLVAKNRHFIPHFAPITSEIVPELASDLMWVLEGNATILAVQNMLAVPQAEQNEVDVLLDGASGNQIFGFCTMPYSLPVRALLSLPLIGGLALRLVKKSFSAEECYRRIGDDIGYVPDDDALLEILSDELAHRVRPLIGESLRKVVQDARSVTKSIMDIGALVSLTEFSRRARVNCQNCYRAKGLEAVDALLDYDIIDFIMTVPHKYRLWRRLVVDEMRMFHQSLMEIPLYGRSHVLSLANASLFIQMVARVTPILKRLLRSDDPGASADYGWPQFLREQRTFFERILFDERTVSRGLFNVGKVRDIFQEHIDYGRYHTVLLLRLSSLELWFRSVEDKYQLQVFRF